MRLEQLIEDEKKKLSASRVGLWITVTLTIVTIAIDVYLTLHAAKAFIPNTVYALEGTMFTAFATWAAGPRIAQYLGPQVGQVATGIAAAARDALLPNNRKDDERGDPTQ